MKLLIPDEFKGFIATPELKHQKFKLLNLSFLGLLKVFLSLGESQLANQPIKMDNSRNSVSHY